MSALPSVLLFDPQADLTYTLELREQQAGVLVGTIRETLITRTGQGDIRRHPVVLSVYMGVLREVDPDLVYASLRPLLMSLARAVEAEMDGGAHVEPIPHT